MIGTHLDGLHEKLIVDHGVPADYRELLDAPVTLEVDGALASRLRPVDDGRA